MILAGGQAYTIQGNYAVPAHSDVSTVLPLPAPAAGPTPPSLNTQTLTTSPFAAHPSSSAFAASHGHPLLSTAHLTTPHHPLHPNPLHASVAGLADPLLKSGHLQAALPPAHLVADAVSLLFFVIRPLPVPFLSKPSPTPSRPTSATTPSLIYHLYTRCITYTYDGSLRSTCPMIDTHPCYYPPPSRYGSRCLRHCIHDILGVAGGITATTVDERSSKLERTRKEGRGRRGEGRDSRGREIEIYR